MKNIVNSKSIKNLVAHAKMFMAIEKFHETNPYETAEGKHVLYRFNNEVVKMEVFNSYIETLEYFEYCETGLMLSEDGYGYVAHVDWEYFDVELPLDCLEGQL